MQRHLNTKAPTKYIWWAGLARTSSLSLTFCSGVHWTVGLVASIVYGEWGVYWFAFIVDVAALRFLG